MSFISDASTSDWMEGCFSTFDLVAAGVADCEFDWFASDSLGRIGFFSSGGRQKVPGCVLRDKHSYLLVARYFHGLKTCGSALVVADSERGDLDDWLYFSMRGLYTFDGGYPTKLGCEEDYLRVTAPARALVLAEQPTRIAKALPKPRLHTDFLSPSISPLQF